MKNQTIFAIIFIIISFNLFSLEKEIELKPFINKMKENEKSLLVQRMYYLFQGFKYVFKHKKIDKNKLLPVITAITDINKQIKQINNDDVSKAFQKINKRLNSFKIQGNIVAQKKATLEFFNFLKGVYKEFYDSLKDKTITFGFDKGKKLPAFKDLELPNQKEINSLFDSFKKKLILKPKKSGSKPIVLNEPKQITLTPVTKTIVLSPITTPARPIKLLLNPISASPPNNQLTQEAKADEIKEGQQRVDESVGKPETKQPDTENKDLQTVVIPKIEMTQPVELNINSYCSFLQKYQNLPALTTKIPTDSIDSINNYLNNLNGELNKLHEFSVDYKNAVEIWQNKNPLKDFVQILLKAKKTHSEYNEALNRYKTCSTESDCNKALLYYINVSNILYDSFEGILNYLNSINLAPDWAKPVNRKFILITIDYFKDIYKPTKIGFKIDDQLLGINSIVDFNPKNFIDQINSGIKYLQDQIQQCSDGIKKINNSINSILPTVETIGDSIKKVLTHLQNQKLVNQNQIADIENLIEVILNVANNILIPKLEIPENISELSQIDLNPLNDAKTAISRQMDKSMIASWQTVFASENKDDTFDITYNLSNKAYDLAFHKVNPLEKVVDATNQIMNNQSTIWDGPVTLNPENINISMKEWR